MKNFWTQDIDDEIRHIDFSNNIKTEVLIIGGGMAGIMIAYLLKNKGIKCVLIEANKIGTGITKNTTAKITSQHGLIYRRLINQIGKENAAKYLSANENAINKFRKICQKIQCDFVNAPSSVYSIGNLKKIEDEVKAVNDIGFKAEFISDIEIPIKIKGAIKFDNQAHFNPIKFIQLISKDLVIYENTCATSVEKNSVSTSKGKIIADNIIIATHFPFINKLGFYFLKMYQQRSYVIALKNAEYLKSMYIDEKSGGLSFRSYKDLLLFGGCGHRTGETGGGYNKLKCIAKILYPHAKPTYSWATQDCITLDGIPYIGKYSKKHDNIFVATGFNKWGMSSSFVSAEILSDMVMGKKNQYESLFSPQRFTLNKRFFIHVGKTVKNFVFPSKKRCSHLGCALKYNKQEHSWDCPCHGSRFSENGDLIDNPAMKGVKIG